MKLELAGPAISYEFSLGPTGQFAVLIAALETAIKYTSDVEQRAEFRELLDDMLLELECMPR